MFFRMMLYNPHTPASNFSWVILLWKCCYRSHIETMKFDLFGVCFCSVGLSQKPENIYKNWNVIRRFENLLWVSMMNKQRAKVTEKLRFLPILPLLRKQQRLSILSQRKFQFQPQLRVRNQQPKAIMIANAPSPAAMCYSTGDTNTENTKPCFCSPCTS